MHHIAFGFLAGAAIGSSLLLGWLWFMASAGLVPSWMKRIHDNAEHRLGGTDLL